MELKEFMTYKNWIVVGDVNNERKYAYKILNELKDKKYTAYGVHPKGGEGIYTNINEVPHKIDVLDLCINNKLGLDYVKEAHKVGIDKILIQPGAESSEIIDFCKRNNINVIEGCALVGLRIY